MERNNTSPVGGRLWDWFCALLLFLLVELSAIRLVVTDWVPDLFFAETLGALAVILGLALGRSLFNTRAVTLLGLAYSVAVVPWHLSTAIDLEGPLLERVASLAARVWFSAQLLARGRAVEDTLFFTVSMASLYWLLGLLAGYHLTRSGNALAVILPTGILTLVIHSYDDYVPMRALPVAMFLFVAIVLLGRLHFAHSAGRSKAHGVLVTEEAPSDIQNHLLVVAAMVIALVWLLPGPIPPLDAATQWWNRMTNPVREDFTNAVSALESPYGSGRSGDFYTETAELGRSAVLGDEAVFRARINTSLVNSPPRYYWRGWAYDNYSDGRWTNSSSSREPFDPAVDELLGPAYPERTMITATLTMRIPRQELLYGPAEPAWVNRPGHVRVAAAGEQLQELFAWTASPALAAGDRYQMRSWLANPNVEELLAAGDVYPAWVQERYLEVPLEIAPALAEVAERVTAGQTTAYEKAAAITEHLRKEIAYSTTSPVAPVGIDPVVWLLSNSKRGFCTYYASAEVLLLRSVGVPSRLAVGFAQGNLESGAYTVLRRDAHAWPEVFFPGIGWVEFEPTVNQAPLVRRTTAPPGLPEDTEGDVSGLPPGLQGSDAGLERAEDALLGQAPALAPFMATPLGRGLIAASFVVVLALLVYANSRRRYLDRLALRLAGGYGESSPRMPFWLAQWAGWAALTPAERSFQAINMSLSLLGEVPPLHATPADRAGRLGKILPSADADIQMVCQDLESALYSQRVPPSGRARRAGLRILARSCFERLRRPFGRWERRYN